MSDAFSLEGRVAVVTGAFGLLGREHARALAAAGADVVLVDLDEATLAAVADEVAAGARGSAIAMAADVADRGALEALRDRVLARFDRIDVLVNNAAIDDKVEGSNALALSRFEEFPLELWERVMRVNVTGTFLASQVLGSAMASRGRGSIVNVASTYGLVAPDQSLYRRPDGTQAFFKSPVYPTSKGAVIAFTRYLAAYFGPKGIRVNALCPGGVENGQEEWFVDAYAAKTPLGRMADRGDYRGAIVFLASDASSYMTGTALVIDGGFTAW